MSNTGQASDLSMDEILASIRKIISEDPKTSAPVAPRPPSSETPTAQARPPLAPSLRPAPPRSTLSSEATSAPRSLKPALDDDILDLMDDEARAPDAVADAVAASPAVAATTGAPKTTLNDMWTPREWSKTSAAVPPSPATVPVSVGDAGLGAASTGANASESSEARMEAAMAALGQSLAAAPPTDPPAKPLVVASAPKTPPPGGPNAGPRIDVVAVVNAATRAALAQRSADEQASMPAMAAPMFDPTPPSPSVMAASVLEPVSVAFQLKPQPVEAPAPVVVRPVPAVRAADPAASAVVTSSVNAAIEAAMAAARTAPTAAEVAKPAPPLAAATSRPEPVTAPTSPLAAPSTPVAAAVPAVAVITQPQPVAAPAPMVAVPATSDSRAQAMSEPTGPTSAGVQTLEDTVARLLRPMLRQWLDDNMPRIVEKAFKEELAAQTATPTPPRRAN